ncbi:MAG: tetratricopeptide repeat protein [Rhodospirillum sp.]|nr:tetratricopeptide repeat protein [Rhodospirillum sp.]MCF8487663.1 tetratricopeptide repeat protein [Rhodospirillum sp.]MCF8500408.1 tetratricopeptide repeat protein [Rhodospirillum sp.]
MIRILLFFMVATALVFGAVWVADRPGAVMVDWMGWRLETSVMVLLIGLVVLVALFVLVTRILGGTLRLPKTIGRNRREKKLKRGTLALGEGIAAARGGDVTLARKLLKDAEKLVPGAAGVSQLSADTAAAAGDLDSAEKAYTAMLDNPRVQASGRRGLLETALARGDKDKALVIAREAMAAGVDAPWAIGALFRLSLDNRAWDDAEIALTKGGDAILSPQDDHKAIRAALLCAQARDAESAGSNTAAERLAKQALDLNPELVEATLIQARALAATGKEKKAHQLVIAHWRRQPHPDLDAFYMAPVRDGDPLKAVKRAEDLAAVNPDHPRSHLLMARAALDARLWGQARRDLEPLAHGQPSRQVCLLMARLEDGENEDLAKANAWLTKALNAEPDAHWVCESCGGVLPTWEPRCGVCGSLGWVSWRTTTRDLAPAAE